MLKKAFELRDRTSEREKLYITSLYYDLTGQFEKAIETNELYKQSYPRDAAPYVMEGVIYRQMGQIEKDLENEQEAIRLDPDQALIPYGNAAWDYMLLNRFDKAKAILNQGLQRNLGGPMAHAMLARVALSQGDLVAMAREDALAQKRPFGEVWTRLRDADLASSQGKARQARELMAKAREFAQRLGVEVVSSVKMNEAAMDANLGFDVQAVEAANSALAISRSSKPMLEAAAVFCALR